MSPGKLRRPSPAAAQAAPPSSRSSGARRPLSLVFRLRRCVFPRPGLYWAVFRHDGIDVVPTYLVVRVR